MGIAHQIKKGIGSLTYNVFGKDIVTGREKDNAGIYVGYNSNNGISVSTPYYGPNASKLWGPGPQQYKPTAYKANAAKTASSIKQGGMTKDEVQDFNIKHPNETAIRGNE